MAKTSTGFSGFHPGSIIRLVCCSITTLIILAGIIALVLYLVYRPSHPYFTVLGAAVYNISNSTSAAPASAIATSMQFTVAIHNPNSRAALQLDRLCAYVSYRAQPITPPSSLPSVYQEADGTMVVSPVLGSSVVPVSPEVVEGLINDEAYGVVQLRLVIIGRVRYRPGPFKSRWVGLFVRCDVFVGVKNETSGQARIMGQPDCDVNT